MTKIKNVEFRIRNWELDTGCSMSEESGIEVINR